MIDQGEPARVVVQIDQTFADNRSVEERDDPVATVKLRVGCEPGRKAVMQCAEVAQRVPHVAWVGVDVDLHVYRGHRGISGRLADELSRRRGPAVLDVLAQMLQ
jgi:hypothetical protein